MLMRFFLCLSTVILFNNINASQSNPSLYSEEVFGRYGRFCVMDLSGTTEAMLIPDLFDRPTPRISNILKKYNGLRQGLINKTLEEKKKYIKERLHDWAEWAEAMNEAIKKKIDEDLKISIMAKTVFNYLNLYILGLLGHAGDLEKGFIKTFIIQPDDQFLSLLPGTIRGVSIFAKGPWNIPVSFDPSNADMPDVVISFSRNGTPLVSVIDYISTREEQLLKMLSTKDGIDSGSHLFISRSDSKTILEFSPGLSTDHPFMVTKRLEIESDNPISKTIEELGLMNQSYLAIPDNNSDVSILDLLLAKYEKVEYEVSRFNQKVETLESDEEDDKDLVLTETQRKKIERQAKREQAEEERKRQEEEKIKKIETRIIEAEENAIQEMMEEIEAKEKYDRQVAFEQEEVRQRVISGDKKRPISSKPSAIKGCIQKKSEEASREADEKENLRIRKLAEEAIKNRITKLNKVARCLNQLFKIFPGAKNKLIRQRGSHLVVDNGPTIVRPHGGDGTMISRHAISFIDGFFSLFT